MGSFPYIYIIPHSFDFSTCPVYCTTLPKNNLINPKFLDKVFLTAHVITFKLHIISLVWFKLPSTFGIAPFKLSSEETMLVVESSIFDKVFSNLKKIKYREKICPPVNAGGLFYHFKKHCISAIASAFRSSVT